MAERREFLSNENKIIYYTEVRKCNMQTYSNLINFEACDGFFKTYVLKAKIQLWFLFQMTV